ncbi:Rieske (2Fe-2S) protein [Spirosoma sp. SC4-14]|uniref:QcrA and Rieske domain-containing protein n=1 Tax=Spirosoma sp. SC4-14 TaxID=3128900 RepID=UPI0030D2FE2A
MENTLPTMDRHEFFRLVGTSIGAILLTRCSAACGQGDTVDTLVQPEPPIDFLINLNDRSNVNLKVKGGYVVINNIIVAQTKEGKYLAVSSKCTHQSNVALVYKATENQFYCPLHLSRFDAIGNVVAGPATKALTQYSVNDLANGTLRVHT